MYVVFLGIMGVLLSYTMVFHIFARVISDNVSELRTENGTPFVYSINDLTVATTNINSSYLTPNIFAMDHDEYTDTNATFPDIFVPGITVSSLTQTAQRQKVLNIGALFEFSGQREKWLSESEFVSSQVAVQHINEANFIPGYKIKLYHNNSKCDPGVGTDVLYDFIYRKPGIVMVMGSACSAVTETLAEIVPNWNLILISYASTSPALSQREKFKTFFRLAPTESANNVARSLFIRNFGWNTVGTLNENKEMYYMAMDGLAQSLLHHNVTIKVSASFSAENGEITAKVKLLKDADARVIIGCFSESAARQVFCEAHKLDMYGPRYVWIIVGDFVENWWETTDTVCSKNDLQKVAEGYFSVSSFSANTKGLSIANLTMDKFTQDYRTFNGTLPLSPYATSTYDTVWTIALTIKSYMEKQERQTNISLEEEDIIHFTYNGGKSITESMIAIMSDLNFHGLSGPVSFNGPDRRGIAVVTRYQGGGMETIAMYEPDLHILNFTCEECTRVIWEDDRIPKDKLVVLLRRKAVDNLVFLVITISCIVGIIASICFLTFNFYQRNLRFIKLSSPKLNNVAVAGCIFVYIGIILLGLDDDIVEDKLYSVFCTSKSFIFAAGFSLSFGAMFTKTYRVHQIFTRANTGLIKRKLLKDQQLVSIIGALLLIDSCIIILWVCVDPMHRNISNLTMEPSEEDIDIVYISQISTCNSVHIDKWLASFYAYKGLLLIFGVYMAWETRNVKIPVLNDSNYIGLNVYNVVIMSIIVVVFSNLLSDQPTLAYIMESVVMLLSTSVTLCLLFVPKIYAILTAKGNPIIATSGILVQDKTRRFIVDDRREIYYRAEVQNRVYKREIIELEQEISRLERLLDMQIEPYPKLTEDLLYQLPESAVDPSPNFRRKRLEEIEYRQHLDVIDRNNSFSISDGGEVCLGNSDEMAEEVAYQMKTDAPFSQKLSRRVSFKEVATKTFSDLRRTFSFTTKTRPKRVQYACTSLKYPLHFDDDDFFLQDGRHQGLKGNDYHIEEESRVLIHKQNNKPIYRDDVLRWRVQITEQSSDEETVQISQIAECERKHSVKRTNSRLRKALQREGAASRVSNIDVSTGSRPISRIESFNSVLAQERRLRIQKLQTDLVRIQRELKDLGDLEYEVSKV